MTVTEDYNGPFIGEAPGRLDVMGGIADYSGSLLLQMPVTERTRVSLWKTTEGLLSIESAHILESERRYFSGLLELTPEESLRDAGRRIRSQPGGDWAVYVWGCFLVLAREKSIAFEGARIQIESNLPLGKGVSSSASLELAVLRAICRAWQIEISPLEMAVLAQRVENQVAGAACGLMDQLAVCFGQAGALLPLICQPHTVFSTVPIPEAIRFFGIDSGIRHAVGAAGYSDVRAAAFMAYTMIAVANGMSVSELQSRQASGERSKIPFGGYLSNINVDYFEQYCAPILPVTCTGAEFMDQYGYTIDEETTIDPEKTYGIRQAARHPVHEQHRCSSFLQHMKAIGVQGNREDLLRSMGELMYAAHASYSAVGLGHPMTDQIVSMCRDAGPSAGIYGARVSGGGSGGTVCVMAGRDLGERTVEGILKKYREMVGSNVCFFGGTASGSLSLAP